MGTKRDYTRQRTAAPGLVNMGIEGRATPTPGAGAWKATASQWAARGGPEMQREIGGGGGGGDSGAAEEMDRDGADGGPGGQQDGQQEIDNGSGEDNGGAAEEMDQDGSGVGGPSGRVYPAGWETKTKDQKRKYWKRRRQSGKGPPPP